MRKGFNGLSILAQDALEQDPFSGHLFVFRGRRGDLVKIIWFDGQGACLMSPRKAGTYNSKADALGLVPQHKKPSLTRSQFPGAVATPKKGRR